MSAPSARPSESLVSPLRGSHAVSAQTPALRPGLLLFGAPRLGTGAAGAVL